MIRRSSATWLFVAMLVAAACAPSAGTNSGGSNAGATGVAQVGGTVRIGFDLDPQTLDYRYMSDTGSFRVGDLVYDGLVSLDGKLKAQPDLAEKWSNPEPTVWIFNLRKGVKWQDGQDFTADDVVYTFTSILTDPAAAFQRSNVAAVSKVEAIDPLTVKFTLSAPFVALPVFLDAGIVPKHIGELNDKSLATKPIGTGAFQLQSWDKGSKLVLTANKSYWAGAPKLDKIELDIIPDITNRLNALTAGDIDMIFSPVTPNDIPRLQANKNLVTTILPSIAITSLFYNVIDPVLSDVRVRRAIASLVDRDTIAKQIFQGMDTSAGSQLLPTSFAFSKDITGPGYDLKKAADYLSSAGYVLDGGAWKKDGKQLEIALSTYTSDANRVATLEFMQNGLNKFGIKTSVVTTDFPTFQANNRAAKFQIALLGPSTIGLDPDKITANLGSVGGSNYSHYKDPVMDKLLADGRAETDQAKRAAIYQQVAKIAADDVIMQAMQYQGTLYAASTKVKNFEFNPKLAMSLFSMRQVFLAQ
jgi:peptide/nickel transport system substrate-binding protein